MSQSRFNALDTIQNRAEYDMEYVEPSTGKISDFFGENTFNDAAMKQYLTETAYLAMKSAIQGGAKISREIANQIASGLQTWAQERGVTHFSHWFQPLTGKNAEKHDSFFNLTPDGKIIEEFGGDVLTQQEPDASSFPGGGMRTTAEARGYTIWDPSSPAFIMEVGGDKTLYIPAAFVTWHGEAQDFKLPLLRSQVYLEKSAVGVCQYFDKNVTRVIATLGWEQEFFLVDEALFNNRPDLQMTGRTLVGRVSAKNQQLEDMYFGSIPERIYAYMRDLETECHKLAIPLRTRHNEVGPAQFEFAPVFEEVNVSVDHNTLLMDMMERVARRHKLACLLHEKPFAGVNGSGKHNNWSMGTNTGKNLLSPGKDPANNLQFLTFFVNTIKAVHDHADILRATIATANNDHRLGANEAPPAIISAYLGATLDQMLHEIETHGKSSIGAVKNAVDLVSKLPDMEKDTTDRNRTSPFAFTGNKFEIRAVGSSQNCAGPMMVMNTIVGHQLNEFKHQVDAAIAHGKPQDQAILDILVQYIKESKAVRFEGNGYSDEWKEEAAKRGLGNRTNTPEALKVMTDKKNVHLFAKSGVLSEKELDAHYHVYIHTYVTKLQIEVDTLADMCTTMILPASINYLSKVAENIHHLKAIGLKASSYSTQHEIVEHISKHITGLGDALTKMHEARHAADGHDHLEHSAAAFAGEVKPLMEEIRHHADSLEYWVEDSHWPLAKYRELFFVR